MCNLAMMYLQNDIPENFAHSNDKRAYDLLVSAKELGYTKALTNLGIFYNRGIYVPKDAMIAKDLFKKASDKGDLDATFYVAYYKLKEASLSENDENYFESANLLRYVVAKEPEHVDANYYLGYIYENGLGVDRDMRSAYRHYKVSCDSSNNTNSKALVKLGNLYFTGEGVGIQDKERAVEYYQRAADLGDQDGLNAMG